jgi:hypothetical protein
MPPSRFEELLVSMNLEGRTGGVETRGPPILKHWRPQATTIPRLQLHAAKAIHDDRNSDPVPSNIGAIFLWLAWSTVFFISTDQTAPIRLRGGCATLIRDRHLRPPRSRHSHHISSKSRSNRIAKSITHWYNTPGTLVAARLVLFQLALWYSSGHPSTTANPLSERTNTFVRQRLRSVFSTLPR